MATIEQLSDINNLIASSIASISKANDELQPFKEKLADIQKEIKQRQDWINALVTSLTQLYSDRSKIERELTHNEPVVNPKEIIDILEDLKKNKLLPIPQVDPLTPWNPQNPFGLPKLKQNGVICPGCGIFFEHNRDYGYALHGGGFVINGNKY